MHVVMIGGSDAGISAALRVRELDRAADVTVVLEDAYPNFSICGIPYYVSGEVSHWRDLAHALTVRGLHVTQIEQLPEVLSTVDPQLGALVQAELAGHGVEVLTGTTVRAISQAPPGGSGHLEVRATAADGTAVTRQAGLVL